MPWDTVKVESRHTSTLCIIHTSIQKLHSRTMLLDIQVLSNVNTFRQKHCVLSMSLTSGLESPEVIWLGLAQIALHCMHRIFSLARTGQGCRVSSVPSTSHQSHSPSLPLPHLPMKLTDHVFWVQRAGTASRELTGEKVLCADCCCYVLTELTDWERQESKTWPWET